MFNYCYYAKYILKLLLFLNFFNQLIFTQSIFIPINNQQSTTYDNIQKYYIDAMTSYCDINYLSKYYNVIYNNETNNLLFTYSTNSDINIVFRGTEFYSLINWKNNLKFHQEPYNSIFMNCNNCYLHTGFYYMYSSLVYHPKFNLLNHNIFNNNNNIHIIGHSLGGALATIFYFELNLIKEKYHYTNNIQLYTYGAPRLANPNFTNHLYQYYNNIYRVVNKKDPIPHLPPSSIEFNGIYSHIHREYFINNYDQLVECSIDKVDPNCSDSVINPISVENHLNYFNKKNDINNLYSICKNNNNDYYQLVHN